MHYWHTLPLVVRKHSLRILFLYLLTCVTVPSFLAAQQRSYIIPDVCAPGMGTYIEIIAEATNRGVFGKDSIYANNPGDSVRVVLDRPEDSTKVIIGPVSVAWDGRMISTHIFVLPNVVPNDSVWSNLREEFRIPISVTVLGQRTPANTDTIYIVRPFTRLESISTSISADSTVLGAVGTGTMRRSVRSRRGAIVTESITLEPNKRYGVATDDPDPLTSGNQGFLPFIWTVRGVFDGNGSTINVSAVGKNGGVGGGGGGGQTCDDALLGGMSGDGVRQGGGSGFTGGAGGGVNSSGSLVSREPSWSSGGSGSGQKFVSVAVSTQLPNSRNTRAEDGGFSLNGVPGGISRNRDSDNPESTGGGTGHPFGRSGRGWAGFEQEPSAGGGHGRDQQKVGDDGGFGVDGLSTTLGGLVGGGKHGNIAVVPIAGGSGAASGNPQTPLGGCAGSGGGGGGAIRLIAQGVNNVGLIAQGGVGEAGTRANNTTPRGGNGSGGHIGIMSKLPLNNLFRLDVTSPTDNNTGAGRMRFDAPNLGIPNRNPAEQQYYASISLDTTSQVRSPFTREFVVTGKVGESTTLRYFTRSTTGTWQQRDTNATSGSTSIDLGFRGRFPAVRNVPLVAQDSLFFLVGAELYRQNRNPDAPPYIVNPKWIFSPAAANIIRIVPLPLISVAAPDSVFAPVTRCETDLTTTSTFITIRNNRGGLLIVDNIRFEGDNAQFMSVSPAPPYRISQDGSQRVRVDFTTNRNFTGFASSYNVRMLIQHNDTLPDIGGGSAPNTFRPSPWQFNLTVPITTIRYDMRADARPIAITNNVLDFGRVGIGGDFADTVRVMNLGARSALRYTVSAAQPLNSTPFQFVEQSLTSNDGVISVPVVFAPTSIGAGREQVLRVRVQNVSAPGACPIDTLFAITLRGTGVQPQLDLMRTTQNASLGTLTTCVPATIATALQITVANSGNDTLNVRSIRMSSGTGATATGFSVSTQNLIIPAGQGTTSLRTFTLHYSSLPTTQATTVIRDTILLETNDARYGARNPFRIPVTLTLRSIFASVRLIPSDTLTFGRVRYFLRSQRTATLANNGNILVTVDITTVRQPYRLLAPTTTRFSLQPNSVQPITVEVFATEAQTEGVTVRDVINFTITPDDAQCSITQNPLIITATPQGPVAMQATLWLDTLRSVDMRTDTMIRLWGRVVTALPNRTDNLRAGFLVERGMFFPKTIRSAFGQASIESSQPAGRDRSIIVNIPSVALLETPTVIAEIQGTPIMTDTMWAALRWLPAETRWSRRDSVYFNDSLANGFMATFVPLLGSPNQPRLTSGPVVGQAPRYVVIAGVQPNPAHNELTLTMNASERGEYAVHLVNMLGSRIFARSWKNEGTILSSNPSPSVTSQTVSMNFDIHNVPQGAYLLRVIAPSGRIETFLIGVER